MGKISTAVFIQYTEDIICGRRAAADADVCFGAAHSDADAVNLLSAISLPDVERFGAGAAHMQGTNQTGKTGAACAVLMDVSRQIGDDAGWTRIDHAVLRLIQANDIFCGESTFACTVLFGILNVGYIFERKPHQAAAVRVDLNGVESKKHAVGMNRRATLFEIEVTADAVNDNQLRLNDGGKSADGLLKPECVKMALFFVRKAAFEVF